MTQGVLNGDAGALGKADNEEFLGAQAAAFAGIEQQAMATLHGTSQERLVGFQRFHEAAWVPQTLIRIRRDPAGAADIQTGGQIQHFLLGAGAAVQQNPRALRQSPGLARLAEADP